MTASNHTKIGAPHQSGHHFELPISIVRIVGADAIKIFNNLTTADLTPLQPGDSVETFVTEVRGRTLGHVTARRDTDGLTLVGPAGQSEAIAEHVDRYTIREDAVAENCDQQFAATIFGPAAGLPETSNQFRTDWIGVDTTLRLQNKSFAGEHVEVTNAEFHDARIHAGFPWWGVDFDAKNLPQEVNRDSIAISFTKGCYLGQETVARLDALGQVQKKLIRLAIREGEVHSGDKIMLDGKPIGRITSVTSDGTLAFAMARRAWFDPGTDATGLVEDNRRFAATVIA